MDYLSMVFFSTSSLISGIYEVVVTTENGRDNAYHTATGALGITTLGLSISPKFEMIMTIHVITFAV